MTADSAHTEEMLDMEAPVPVLVLVLALVLAAV